MDYFVDGSAYPVSRACHIHASRLTSIQSAMDRSSMLSVVCEINRIDRSGFSDSQVFIDYIRGGLMPVCNSYRRFNFIISFFSDKNEGANVIASILQLPQIRNCSTVRISLHYIEPVQMPVEAISNWLCRMFNPIQRQSERHLELFCHSIQNSCAEEIFEFMKKVCYFISISKYSSIISTHLISLNSLKSTFYISSKNIIS